MQLWEFGNYVGLKVENVCLRRERHNETVVKYSMIHTVERHNETVVKYSMIHTVERHNETVVKYSMIHTS